MFLNPTQKNTNPKNMLRGNPPQPPNIPFSFYLFSFTFQKKSENFGGGGGGWTPPLNTPLCMLIIIIQGIKYFQIGSYI